MRIKVEPKDFFMYSVFLAFDKENPDWEDPAVYKYLEDHELIPKALFNDKIEGIDHEVMYFGGCYIGRHLNVVEGIQRDAVRQEMLGQKIAGTVRNGDDPDVRRLADGIPEPELVEIMDEMVQGYNDDSSFTANEEGYLVVNIEPEDIAKKFVEVAGSRSG